MGFLYGVPSYIIFVIVDVAWIVIGAFRGETRKFVFEGHFVKYEI